jgi:phospholipid/cholesterol/gamma-HCH transport system substrate-binding protein
MDLHRKQEVTVGALVLAGIALFVIGTMWLRGVSFSRRPEVTIQFTDAGTIKKGSAVRVSGVTMGSVNEVVFEDVGRVLVTINLSPKIHPKIDATARLVSVGLTGDAAINLDPGRSTTPLPPGRPIQGIVGQGLTDLGAELGQEAKATMASVRQVANEQLAADLHATMTALQKFMSVFTNTQRGPTAELTATLVTLQRLSNRIDSSVASADLARTLRKGDTLSIELTKATSQLASTTARLDTLLGRLQQGQGTIGKLITDSLLYSDLRRSVTSLQQFVDTLRKYPGKIGVTVKLF